VSVRLHGAAAKRCANAMQQLWTLQMLERLRQSRCETERRWLARNPERLRLRLENVHETFAGAA